MDPINSINQLMAILKRQMTERGEPSARNTGPSNTSTTQNDARRSTTKPGPEEIQRRIGQRLRNLEPGERLGNRGTQVFIESVLAWEFGDDVLADPGFGELVASVREILVDDPDLQKSMQRLVEQLMTKAE